MRNVFDTYAKYYDFIYADKDYEDECNFLEAIFRSFSDSKPRRILDLGCGTGGHAIPLARRGYRVFGVDRSAAMLDIAREKAKQDKVPVNFCTGDIRTLQLDQQYDACICMFAVMSYQTQNKDIQATLASVRRHLYGAGLFVFDFWYGPTVLTILPSPRIKIAEAGGIRVIRLAIPKLDALHHTVDIDYTLIVAQGNHILNEVHETHKMRFLFAQELRHYLEEHSFDLVHLCPFLDLEAKVSEKHWNATAIAKAV